MTANEHVSKNVFDEAGNQAVPVTVEINGKKTVVGEAVLSTGDDGFVYASMTLKTDDANDVKTLFSNGITGVSIADVAPDISEDQAQALMEFPAHDHKPVQHRDARKPWCNTCGLTGDMTTPRRNFGDDPGPSARAGKPRGQFGLPAPADDIHKP